jgi:DNA-binding response OmpR family regulator
MIRQTLAGRSILVVEDEPLIAMDIATEFESRGARVVQTHTLREAVDLVEEDGLSAAILDHGLPDGDSTKLCERLAQKRIPFVTYSGYHRLDGACTKGAVVEKPAPPSVLVTMVESLLKQQNSRA